MLSLKKETTQESVMGIAIPTVLFLMGTGCFLSSVHVMCTLAPLYKPWNKIFYAGTMLFCTLFVIWMGYMYMKIYPNLFSFQ